MIVKDLLGNCLGAVVQGQLLKVGNRVFTPQQFLNMGFLIEECSEDEQRALERLGIESQCAKSK